MSLLGCKALCIDINFVFIRSICLSSLFILRLDQRIFHVSTAQMFIPLMRFLLLSLVWRSFLVRLNYSCLTFSFVSICFVVSISTVPSTCNFPFLQISLSAWHIFSISSSIIISFTPLEFFTSALADGFSLDSKSLRVSRTLLSILAVFNNAVVWMAPTRRQLPSPLGPLIILLLLC